MAPTLGKRKRRDQLENAEAQLSHGEDTESNSTVEALLRKHFESTFEPLEIAESLNEKDDFSEGAESTDQAESEWSGFSEQDPGVARIIEYSITRSAPLDLPRDLKIFMTAKPPSSVQKVDPITKQKQQNPDDLNDPTDAANLKKDLALQRLLKESHLLDQESSLSHFGRNRHKALDLRIQDMGSKSSIFKQDKMPLVQRKGILAKAAKKEENRRRAAQENGIILEKAAMSKAKEGSMRQRGVGAPSVGKFQGGMLKLSKKDIADIRGPKKKRGRQ